MTNQHTNQRTEHSMSESVRHFWELVRKYKFMFFLLLLAVFLVETTVVLEKYFFKLIIDNGTAYAEHTITRNVLVELLVFVAIAFLLMVLFRAILKWLHMGLINRLDSSLIADLKRKFFNHIVGLSHGFHTTHKTGSLISKLSRGGRAIESMMDAIVFNFAPMTFQLVVAAFAIYAFSFSAAICVLLTVLLFVAFSVYVQAEQYPARVRANDTEDIEKANIGDIFMNVDSIKYFGKEEQIKRKFRQLSENTRRDFLHMWDYYRTLDAGHTLIIGVGSAIIIYFPLQAFLDGQMTIGSVVFIYTVYLGLLSPMYRFVQGMRSFYQASADFESIYQYDSIRNDIVDKSNAPLLEIKRGGGGIEYRNVTFHYNRRKIFKNFHLKIAPNERVAIVGHSGSGKSTMIKLLYRFYDVEQGEILIDGVNIRGYQQESLRSNMSVVPQECVLFDDTIYNNVAFSRPDATRAEVEAAIRFAQLDKIIEQFPMKEQTIVGERGVRLSGGEKQRVSIARALLANKRILVLDEATSSLDSKTEHEIQQDLRRLMQGKTTIIIAHRLSTIMHADRIIVLERGRIVQQGTHQQLIRARGVYKQLWELQKGGYIEAYET